MRARDFILCTLDIKLVYGRVESMLIGLSSVLMNAQVYKMHMEMNSEQCTPLENKVEPEKQFQQERFGTRLSNLK